MRIVHLLASPFFGGPERQVLGLARHLPADYESVFLTFAERGKAQALLDEVARHRFEGKALRHNFPQVRQATAEVVQDLRRIRADILCTSGYKPDLLGWRAARQTGVPVVSISHGWTGASFKVRCYEAADRLVLRWMDAVVAVSEAQAEKIRRASVPERLIRVIPNAIGDEAFAPADKVHAEKLRGFFAEPPRRIVGAAGRLSPEKGFDVLVAAAAQVLQRQPDTGFILFGAGPLREDLVQQIKRLGLNGRFVLAGFRPDVTQFLAHLDLAVLASHTEGLPVFVLEACAAGIAVVATAVGGIPEVIEDGANGLLVPPGQPAALADKILALLGDDARRRLLGRRGRKKIRDQFLFTQQSERYQELFQEVKDTKHDAGRRRVIMSC